MHGTRWFVCWFGLICLVSSALLAGCAAHAPSSGPASPTLTSAAAGPIANSVAPAATPGHAASGAAPSPAGTSAGSTAHVVSTPTPSVPATTSAHCRPAGRFVTRAPGTGKTVALTFDDGPGPADTRIAAILAAQKVHATFFETGRHAAADPATTKMLAAGGNLIADHTWDHYYPTQVKGGWSVAYLTDQLTRTDTELTSLTGRPVCYFRPPGGFRNNVLTTVGRLKLTAVLWSTDSQDWKQPPRTTTAATNSIIARATAVGSNQHPIVLMHSTKASHEPESQVSSYRGNTVAALPKVIAWYRSHGYRFVLMDGAS